MAALSSSYETEDRAGEVQSYRLAAATAVYTGSLVVVATASGYLAPATDTAGLVFVGVAYESGDNASGAAGDVAVRVRKRGSFVYDFTGGGYAQTLIGQPVYAADDHTVSMNGSPATHVRVGTVVDLASGGRVRILIDGAVG